MHGTQGMGEIATITVPLTHTETGVARQVSQLTFVTPYHIGIACTYVPKIAGESANADARDHPPISIDTHLPTVCHETTIMAPAIAMTETDIASDAALHHNLRRSIDMCLACPSQHRPSYL
jgi:hypothetical protein